MMNAFSSRCWPSVRRPWIHLFLFWNDRWCHILRIWDLCRWCSRVLLRVVLEWLVMWVEWMVDMWLLWQVQQPWVVQWPTDASEECLMMMEIGIKSQRSHGLLVWMKLKPSEWLRGRQMWRMWRAWIILRRCPLSLLARRVTLMFSLLYRMQCWMRWLVETYRMDWHFESGVQQSSSSGSWKPANSAMLGCALRRNMLRMRSGLVLIWLTLGQVLKPGTLGCMRDVTKRSMLCWQVAMLRERPISVRPLWRGSLLLEVQWVWTGVEDLYDGFLYWSAISACGHCTGVQSMLVYLHCRMACGDLHLCIWYDGFLWRSLEWNALGVFLYKWCKSGGIHWDLGQYGIRTIAQQQSDTAQLVLWFQCKRGCGNIYSVVPWNHTIRMNWFWSDLDLEWLWMYARQYMGDLLNMVYRWYVFGRVVATLHWICRLDVFRAVWFGWKMFGRLVYEWLLDVRLNLSFVTCEMSGFWSWRFHWMLQLERFVDDVFFWLWMKAMTWSAGVHENEFFLQRFFSRKRNSTRRQAKQKHAFCFVLCWSKRVWSDLRECWTCVLGVFAL